MVYGTAAFYQNTLGEPSIPSIEALSIRPRLQPSRTLPQSRKIGRAMKCDDDIDVTSLPPKLYNTAGLPAELDHETYVLHPCTCPAALIEPRNFKCLAHAPMKTLAFPLVSGLNSPFSTRTNRHLDTRITSQ